MRWLCAWLGLAVLLTGCTVDRTGLGTRGQEAGPTGQPDGGHVDGGRIDSGPTPPRDSGPRDSGPPPPPDVGPPDAGPPDSGPPDAGPPDSGPPDAGPPSCDSLFGTVASYQPCAETASSCEFYTDDPVAAHDCNEVCGSAGCIGAYNNVDNGSGACTHTADGYDCTSSHLSIICVCNR